MTDQEAAALVKEAFGDGAYVRRNKQVCEVVAKDGSVLGRAFSWRPAVQQAVKPLLDAKAKDAAEAWEAARADMALFGDFLRAYLRKEFEEWKVKRAAGNQSPDAGGAQAGEKQLVQVDAETQRPGEAGPSRLILPGRE